MGFFKGLGLYYHKNPNMPSNSFRSFFKNSFFKLWNPLSFYLFFGSSFHAKDITIKYIFVTNDMKSFLFTRTPSS